MQQLAGAIVIALAAIPTGEFADLDVGAVTAESALALLYLIVFGSLLTLSAYLWLLRVARTSLVATYAYVNPVVAVTLGWLILDERVAGMTLVAAGVILASVALIVSAGSAARPRGDGDVDAVEPVGSDDAVEHRRAKREAEIGFEG
jgi:drug/metabolite transporter (DMT)-like permease